METNIIFLYLAVGLLRLSIYLYYYSRRVFTLPSSKFDENLPGRSQFYSDHHVNFSTLTSCQSATFGPLAFCICPLLLRQKSSKNHKCGESISIGVIDEVLSVNDEPNTLLQINR